MKLLLKVDSTSLTGRTIKYELVRFPQLTSPGVYAWTHTRINSINLKNVSCLYICATAQRSEQNMFVHYQRKLWKKTKGVWNIVLQRIWQIISKYHPHLLIQWYCKRYQEEIKRSTICLPEIETFKNNENASELQRFSS